MENPFSTELSNGFVKVNVENALIVEDFFNILSNFGKNRTDPADPVLLQKSNAFVSMIQIEYEPL